jgi:signal peptide peptidase SppA
MEPFLAPAEMAAAWIQMALAPWVASGEPENSRGKVGVEPLGGGLVRMAVHGVMMRSPLGQELGIGAVDTMSLTQAAENAANDDRVRGVLLDVDSPGGFLVGGPEAADALSELSARKPLVSWTGGMMASLAYWMGSQAHAVMASKSAQVGSIGAIITLRDWSRLLEHFGIRTEVFTNREAIYKGTGVFGVPLTDAQRGYVQSMVDGAFTDFNAGIERRRRVNPEAMQGQVLRGAAAVNAGLVNQIGSFRDAVSALRHAVS